MDTHKYTNDAHIGWTLKHSPTPQILAPIECLDATLMDSNYRLSVLKIFFTDYYYIIISYLLYEAA